ncbi:MAG: nucleoside kinase [Bacilli bacterium]|nr:nucleoside kinase [Bacilli bacterium]MBO6285366.1 nucleoside kinase [Bacilli bacterium]
MSFTVEINNKKFKLDKKTPILELIKEYDPEKRAVAARVDNRVRELTYDLSRDCKVEILTVKDPDAVKVYEASLRYVVAMAFARCYPGLKIRFAYNVSRCVSIHILNNAISANTAMLLRITHEIDNIIKKDIPLKRMKVSLDEAIKVYDQLGYDDKKAILEYRPEDKVHLYSADGFLDYMYSHMVPSTGYLHEYKLRLYSPGFMLQYPRAEAGGAIPPFRDDPVFNRTLRESHEWASIVGSDTVGGINNSIKKRGTIEFINLCEARHNRMLCELGQLIEDSIDDISLICIAGPSSSGKTTFANRLRIELLSRGINPIRISLDDYYLPRDQAPLDENGKPDLEHIEALDIALFNQNMLDLINGESVTLPRFDFQLGQRVIGRTIRVAKNEPIIIEGIHALNDRMTIDIPKSAKFKIFIAPQAQMNIDDHNPLTLTDLRLIRRIVRDYKFRNASAEETLSMWPSVRAGEFRWIYDCQENSDYVYNSMLSYELPVMKKYALPLLREIDNESPYFPTAQRLIRMLKYFIDMPDEWVPSNSLMREFIGGSCYADV